MKVFKLSDFTFQKTKPKKIHENIFIQMKVSRDFWTIAEAENEADWSKKNFSSF